MDDLVTWLIVEDCAEYVGSELVTDGLSARTLARLALPYANRAGYRDEWRPVTDRSSE